MALEYKVKYNRVSAKWIVVEFPKGHSDFSRPADSTCFDTETEAKQHMKTLCEQKRVIDCRVVKKSTSFLEAWENQIKETYTEAQTVSLIEEN